MRATLRSRGRLLCLVALIIAGSAAPQADGQQTFRKPVTLSPLATDAESFALGINDRGYVVGYSSSADNGSGTMNTAMLWDRSGNPMALLPLAGDHESIAVAINNAGQIVGNSRDSSGACPRDTAVMWLLDGTVRALPPLSDGVQSVANGIGEQGMVAGTSKGPRFDPDGDCSSAFTPVFWGPEGTPTALSPLEGFPEGYATTVTSTGAVVGGSANTTTGFDFQVTVWRPRQYKARLLQGPDGSFLNIASGANANGMVVGDSFDFTFAQRGVVWDIDGNPSLRPPLHKGTASTGRAVNGHGLVAGSSIGDGLRTAVIWNRHGKPRGLRPLPGDSQSEGTAINRSGQVAGRSFGGGTSTAVFWSTR